MMVYMAPSRLIAEQVRSFKGSMSGPHPVRPACAPSCVPARWVEEHEHETEVEYL